MLLKIETNFNGISALKAKHPLMEWCTEKNHCVLLRIWIPKPPHLQCQIDYLNTISTTQYNKLAWSNYSNCFCLYSNNSNTWRIVKRHLTNSNICPNPRLSSIILINILVRTLFILVYCTYILYLFIVMTMSMHSDLIIYRDALDRTFSFPAGVE